MKILTGMFLALVLPLGASEASDHAGKAAGEAKAAVESVGQSAKEAVKKAQTKAGDAVQAAGDAVKDAGSAVATAAKEKSAQVGEVLETAVQVEPLKAVKAGATDHLHNKIVHFPIALGIFGAIFLLMSYRYPTYKWPARTLLFFAAVAAVFALPTGEHMEGGFDGTSFTDVLGAHENAGKTSMFMLWGAFILSFFEVTRKFFWFYALLLIGFLLLTGGLGGVLAAA